MGFEANYEINKHIESDSNAFLQNSMHMLKMTCTSMRYTRMLLEMLTWYCLKSGPYRFKMGLIPFGLVTVQFVY